MVILTAKTIPPSRSEDPSLVTQRGEEAANHPTVPGLAHASPKSWAMAIRRNVPKMAAIDKYIAVTTVLRRASVKTVEKE